MQFKHPEILFALLFLLVPLLIHFFRLRRYKKEFFTNVAFLKRLKEHSRKSSQLKKWLILATRMLGLAALIFAFAQPYKPSDDYSSAVKETVIYLDNSFSMQQTGEKGELLQQAVQEIIQHYPQEQSVKILTNDEVYLGDAIDEVKNDLLQINYSSADASFNSILLKAENLFSKQGDSKKQFVAISDFQEHNFQEEYRLNPAVESRFIQLSGHPQINFSIDSAVVQQSEGVASELEVYVSASEENDDTLPVDLYKDKELIAKSSADFDGRDRAQLSFTLPAEEEDFKGLLEITDKALAFDNRFYFSLQKNIKIKIAGLSEEEERASFMERLYRKTEFDYHAFTPQNLNYNLLSDVDFMVLNELKEIPVGLNEILEKHLADGGYLSVIPHAEAHAESYKNLFLSLNLGRFSDFEPTDLKIATINFDHPLYKNVFEFKVDNFQYPEVSGKFNFEHFESVLKYNNSEDFLTKRGNVYLFSAPISKDNSNFKQSPLIVPTFYNMALQSSPKAQLFYTLGAPNTLSLPVSSIRDEVVHLKNGDTDYIPPQRQYRNQVVLDLQDYPVEAGHYQPVYAGEVLGDLSFNYNRKENELHFMDFNGEENNSIDKSITDYFLKEELQNKNSDYWKYFLAMGLFCLLVEFILLRFLK